MNERTRENLQGVDLQAEVPGEMHSARKTWPIALCAALLAVGCDNAASEQHAAPRDVEAVADVADTADAVETADSVDAQSDGGDIFAGDDGGTVDVEVKNCPPGTQIAGCPCERKGTPLDYGCCLGPNRGLTCSGVPSDFRWSEVADCCTMQEPWCGGDKPPSGWDPLCLSKPLP